MYVLLDVIAAHAGKDGGDDANDDECGLRFERTLGPLDPRLRVAHRRLQAGRAEAPCAEWNGRVVGRQLWPRIRIHTTTTARSASTTVAAAWRCRDPRQSILLAGQHTKSRRDEPRDGQPEGTRLPQRLRIGIGIDLLVVR